MKKVLVTGGAGFVGSHVAEAYLMQGWDVTILDTKEVTNKHKDIRYLKGDITKRGIGLDNSNLSFDVINHQAASVDPMGSIEDPYPDAETNIMGTINVLELAVKLKAKVIFASTACVYSGLTKFPVREENVSPTIPYGASKLSAENYVRLYHDLKGVPYMILRYGNVYGPGDGRSVIDIFYKNLIENKPLIVNGTGRQTRDYIHVSDVAEANVLASDEIIKTKSTGGIEVDNNIFNISTGLEFCISFIARTLTSEDNIIIDGTKNAGAERCCMLPFKANDILRWHHKEDFRTYLSNLKEAIDSNLVSSKL